MTVTSAIALAGFAALAAGGALLMCIGFLANARSISQTSTQRFSSLEKRLAAVEVEHRRSDVTMLRGEVGALADELASHRRSQRSELGKVWQRIGAIAEAEPAEPASRDELRARLLAGQAPVGLPTAKAHGGE